MEELKNLFQSFRKEAFRLELLESYKAEGEWEEFQSYLAGQFLPDLKGFQPWLDQIASTTAEGRCWRRVHVSPRRVEAYLKYEIEWGYLYSAQAGEKIGICAPDIFEQCRPRDFSPGDYWLFDDEVVVELQYDADGNFRGATKRSDPDVVAPYVALKNILLERAQPLDQFLAELRRQPTVLP